MEDLSRGSNELDRESRAKQKWKGKRLSELSASSGEGIATAIENENVTVNALPAEESTQGTNMLLQLWHIQLKTVVFGPAYLTQ